MSRAAALGVLLLAGVAMAHEGHDHGPPPPATVALAPRASASTADFELVAVIEADRLRVYLDDFRSNRPVQDASVEVESGAFQGTAAHAGEGVYTLEAGPLSAPGGHDLLFTVRTPAAEDLLITRLEVPAPVPESGAAVAGAPSWHESAGVLRVAVVGLALWVLVLLARRDLRAVPRAVLVAAAVLLASAAPDPLLAHAGDDHVHAEAPPPAGAGAAAAVRLPDASVLVPKPVQRLLGLRTAPAEAGEWPDAFALNGHVIPDPNASGLVQAPLRGRIELPEGGLPLLGARVEQGQVLAYLAPILDAVDRTTLQANLAEIAGRVVILSRNLERLRQLGNNAPRQEMEQTEAELESLLARRRAITDSFEERRPLAAPVSGVLALRNASPGQIVEGRETLFTVVDPQRLWVEALLYDTEHATHFVAATARTAGGEVLRLTPIGGGYELRGHALPLQFRIEPPVPFLVVRQPLKVFAQAYHSRRGLRVPTAAVLRGPDGADLVWVHERPEQFRSRRVRAAELGRGYSLVTEGLEPGARVVTEGAALLAQVR
jgi:hypothetical protein